MLGNLTGFAFVSLLSLGSYAGSFVTPHSPHIISPLPRRAEARRITTLSKPKATPTPIPTNTPTPLPTNTPTPIPTNIPTPLPTDTPTPTPSPRRDVQVTSSDLDGWFSKYASEQSVDENLLKKIANCESSFNTNASYMDYVGMYQFGPSSWTAVRQMMNEDPNPDLRTNPEEAIKTAAFKIAHGGQNAWPNCSK